LLNYFVALVVLMLVHGSNPQPEVGPSGTWAVVIGRAGTLAAAAGGALAAAALAAFLLSPAPLQLTVSGSDRHINASGDATVTLTVVAVNRTDQPITPTFAVTSKGYLNPGWRPDGGPAVVPPHGSRTYHLVPVGPQVTLASGLPFLVDALAANPSSISTSEWMTAR
jgi:hypothetical protein